MESTYFLSKFDKQAVNYVVKAIGKSTVWTDRQSMDPLLGVPLTSILKSLLGLTAQWFRIPPRGSYSSRSFIVNGSLFHLRNLHKIRSSWQHILDPLF